MASEAELAAAALPGYTIGSELGRGEFGAVFEATDRSGRRVVVKHLTAANATDPGVRERFAREGRLITSLVHPNVVQVLDAVERDGVCILVSERVDGGTLQRRDLSPQAAVDVVVAACRGVEHAHRSGVLHRDLHPGNVFFGSDGTGKVADFGQARIVGGNQTVATRAGAVLGSPAYMAPEQALGEELSAATDVYALATILYELLAGRVPFAVDGDDLTVLSRHVQEEPARLLDVAPTVSPGVAAVVMRALARDPGQRYASADAFAGALADATAPAAGAVTSAETMAPPSAAETMAPPAATAETIAPPSAAETMAAPVAAAETIAPQAAPAPLAPPPVTPPAAGGRRPWLVPVLVLVVVAAAVVAFLATRPSGKSKPVKKVAASTVIGPREVTVPGDRSWTDSGIDLRANDDVAIAASGTVLPSKDIASLQAGPNGVFVRPDIAPYNVVKDAEHSSLIGRVADGPPFFVGADKRFSATAPGRLFLGINDTGVENNAGAFQARVTITRRR
jgi:hypothetical protein